MNKTKILIINQHGENRGDEAAMRGMLHGISKHFPNASFALICQFMDRDLSIDFREDAEILPMLIPIQELPGLATFLVLKLMGIESPAFLGSKSRKIIERYRDSDIVLSAPGGPYFGDIYSGAFGYHELAHWLMVFIAKLYQKPTILYSPSAGPFKKCWLNPIRKYFYRYFKRLAIREEISKAYLEQLLPTKKVYLTADSALQKKIKPWEKRDYFKEKISKFKDKFLVSISANDYKYPLSPDPEENKRNYLKNMVDLIVYISEIRDSHFIMYPQLYGKVHSDVPFLELLGSLLPASVSWEIIDPNLDSDHQQAIWGMTDFTLASRYHPQIFSAMHGIPYLCIYYEHKQLGFIKSLGLEEFACDIYELDAAKIRPKIKKAIENREAISRQIMENIKPIIERSKTSSSLVAEIMYDEKSTASPV